jgi:predicted PurR-regulated permease PerM
VRVHTMLVFFAVITGGELFGVLGVVLAVPTMAMLRVLYDFLRVRVHVMDETFGANGSITERQPRKNDLERRSA